MSLPNQPPPLVDYSLFEIDTPLREAVARDCAGWAIPELEAFGRIAGAQETINWGFQANENPPTLRTHDRFGERIDQVEFHPAWHSLMALSMRYGLHSRAWSDPRPGAHVARAALMSLASQNEQGHTCPVSMTYSALPALRREPELARTWEPLLLSTSYDPRFRHADSKTGILIGMGMTERQGGSDVRANITRAEPAGANEYFITGHKWFCSAPMSDAFLVLAQAPAGLTCFLLPRWTPEGRPNAFHIQRLKAKLGNRSNASSEVEFHRAWAARIGEEGLGVRSIIGMVQHTRLDCVIGSSALIRQALTQAIHHARHRSAFGRPLIHQPLMRNVLADLAIESEAATLLMLRIARAFDSQQTNPAERAFSRLGTAIAKFHICKRAPAAVNEALECLGGNGYVEECVLPRLYREAPLNSIWEGSGNVICLDILRVIEKEPEAVAAILAELRLAKGTDARFDAYLNTTECLLASPAQHDARRLAHHLGSALQACLVLRHSPPALSEAFCATRLASHHSLYGTLPANLDLSQILDRAYSG